LWNPLKEGSSGGRYKKKTKKDSRGRELEKKIKIPQKEAGGLSERNGKSRKILKGGEPRKTLQLETSAKEVARLK